MHEMLRLVPDLIAAGASARDIVGILSSDRAKSWAGALAPRPKRPEPVSRRVFEFPENQRQRVGPHTYDLLVCRMQNDLPYRGEMSAILAYCICETTKFC